MKPAIVRKVPVWLLALTLSLLAQEQLHTDSSIEVTAPLGGGTYHVGDTLRVDWVLHNGAEPGGGVVVLISPDDGRDWVVIVPRTLEKNDPIYYSNDSVGTFTWVIQDSVLLYVNHYISLVSDQVQVSVAAPYDEVFAPDYSGSFTILPSSAAVRMLSRPGDHSQDMKIDLGGNRVEVFSLSGRRLPPGEGPAATRWKTGVAAGVHVVRLGSGADETTGLLPGF
jgi:hypothetical protein